MESQNHRMVRLEGTLNIFYFQLLWVGNIPPDIFWYTSTPQYSSSEKRGMSFPSYLSTPFSGVLFFSSLFLQCIFGSHLSAKVSKQNLKDLFLLDQTCSFQLFFCLPLLQHSASHYNRFHGLESCFGKKCNLVPC